MVSRITAISGSENNLVYVYSRFSNLLPHIPRTSGMPAIYHHRAGDYRNRNSVDMPYKWRNYRKRPSYRIPNRVTVIIKQPIVIFYIYRYIKILFILTSVVYPTRLPKPTRLSKPTTVYDWAMYCMWREMYGRKVCDKNGSEKNNFYSMTILINSSFIDWIIIKQPIVIFYKCFSYKIEHYNLLRFFIPIREL